LPLHFTSGGEGIQLKGLEMARRKIPTRGTKTPEGTRQISTKWPEEIFQRVDAVADTMKLSFAELNRAIVIKVLPALERGETLDYVASRGSG
jgi:hypothetical protein